MFFRSRFPRTTPRNPLQKQAPTAVHFDIVANSTHSPPTHATKPNTFRHLLRYSRARPLPVQNAPPAPLFQGDSVANYSAPHDKAPQMPIPSTLLLTTNIQQSDAFAVSSPYRGHATTTHAPYVVAYPSNAVIHSWVQQNLLPIWLLQLDSISSCCLLSTCTFCTKHVVFRQHIFCPKFERQTILRN